MNILTKLNAFLFVILLAGTAPAVAQDAQAQTPKEKKAAYLRVVTPRADKIVANLGITDSSKYKKVRSIIAQQYSDLNDIHEARNAKIKAVKADTAQGKEAIAAKVKALEDASTVKLDKLHKKYISSLSKYLTEAQVVKVKDGMTYGVVPITYKGYVDMIPVLTEEQKKQIYDWLVEAREHAMDAESSDKKHAWFGKYKGKINNYLSAQGYDTKKYREVWEKKLKEEQEAAARQKQQ